MKKILSIMSAAVLTAGALVMATGTATAQPTQVVSPGLQISFSGNPGVTPPAPFSSPTTANFCTLGVVGNDKYGNSVGISAGHCTLSPGNPTAPFEVYASQNLSLGPIGVVTYNGNPDNAANPQTLTDYNVIKFDTSKVTLSSNGPALRVDGIHSNSAGQPVVPPVGWFGGANLCKDGAATGLRCGLIIGKQDGGRLCSLALNSFGDSGGPAVLSRNNGQNTKWVGITTRQLTNCAPYEYLSAAYILGDLNPRNIVGSGFVPSNTP